jgi:hypothetical protein
MHKSAEHALEQGRAALRRQKEREEGAMATVGEGAVLSRAEEVVSSLVGNHDRDKVTVQKALEAERAEAIAEGMGKTSAEAVEAAEARKDAEIGSLKAEVGRLTEENALIRKDDDLKELRDRIDALKLENDHLTSENQRLVAAAAAPPDVVPAGSDVPAPMEAEPLPLPGDLAPAAFNPNDFNADEAKAHIATVETKAELRRIENLENRDKARSSVLAAIDKQRQVIEGS